MMMRNGRSRLAASLWVVPFLVLASCGPDGTGEPSQTAEEPASIVGGTPTYARPEVGLLTMPGGGYCTATLISNRHFLTAGHCIDYRPILRGGTLRVTSADGTWSSTFAVDRILAQNVQRTIVNGDDVAVGRLTTAVDASLATPATIATSQPQSGELDTAMGYGCTSRTGQPGGGTKRYLQYTYNGTDRYLCPGDSGGPVFRGGLSANGSILRVHSGYWIDTGIDIGADAVAQRGNILALDGALETRGVCYRAYLQGSGWQATVCDGAVGGLDGLRLEGLQIWSASPYFSNLCYTAYVGGSGWQSEVCDGDLAGVLYQSKPIEAVKIRVVPGTGIPPAVMYQVKTQGLGWGPETWNGEIAGTIGRRIEQIKIVLRP